VTENQAAAIVRTILEKPTREAFDCASGAIVRLFAHCHELKRRLACVEARIRALEGAPIGEPALAETGGPSVAATTTRQHRGRHQWPKPARKPNGQFAAAE
jgi:hypothetical protein